jgi:hypothetical protein
MKELWMQLNCRVDAWIERVESKRVAWFAYYYGLIHLVMGFYVLWYINYEINFTLKEIGSSDLLAKSILETCWLFACVYWGNIGWDRFKTLKSERKFKSALTFVVFGTAPVLILLPILVLVAKSWLNIANYGHPLIFGFSSPVMIWVYCGTTYLLISCTLRKNEKSV